MLDREDHNLRGSYTVLSLPQHPVKMEVISLQLLCLRTAIWQQMLWMHKRCSIKLKRLQICNRCRNRSLRWTKCPNRHWFQQLNFRGLLNPHHKANEYSSYCLQTAIQSDCLWTALADAQTLNALFIEWQLVYRHK